MEKLETLSAEIQQDPKAASYALQRIVPIRGGRPAAAKPRGKDIAAKAIRKDGKDKPRTNSTSLIDTWGI